ncbi:MAG: endoribonuclease MazF [Gemmatimonadaceae bacterium]|nr:endoribonuclease MazF [Gemmatimonadaceae bacterium]
MTSRGSRRKYVPERGEAVWLDFDPQAGHEQSGRRPAVVLSPQAYNERAGLAILCPITSRVKGYPFEVLLPTGLPLSGAVLSDQLRSLDWKARKASRICRLPEDVTEEILGKLRPLLDSM